MKPLDMLAALAVVVIWGANFVAAKLGTALIPPLAMTAVRFLLVAAILLPLYGLPRRSALGGVALLSVTLGVLHFGLIFVGVKGVDAATAAVAIQLTVPFSALLAAVFFHDRLGWWRGLGMALAFSGVALLAGEPTLPDLAPFLTLVAAAFFWAVSNVVIKRLRGIPPIALNGWMALFAAPQLVLLSLIFEDGQLDALAGAGWVGWGAIAYTVLAASLIAYTMWYHLLARYDMNQVVPFTLLGPVIGIACGVLLLGETLNWHKVVGGVVTIAGVAVVQFATRRPA
ncbi:MAG: EamA family transporter [Alphaproteobacteria bacterium]|nr:EamA family transporter [Alphaproteobacteria bacterium]